MTCIPDNKVKNSFSKFDIFAAFCFLAALAFLLWKAPYGTVSHDECFYPNIPYRLWQGDSMLTHEWHPGQLFGFLLLPVFSLFMAINGSTDGVFLFLRILFVATQFIGAVYIYVRLRRFQPIGVLLSSLSLLLYAPLQIMSLSYNTMGILLLSATCATMLTGRRINFAAPFSGLLFAGAVLCCPYLVLIYIAYSICSLVPAIRKKLDMPAFAPGYWLRFSGGCAALATAFFIFLLLRCSFDELFTTIPLILNDPEHPKESFAFIIFKYLESLYGNYFFTNVYYNIISASIAPLLAIIMLIDKKRIEHRLFYIIPTMLLTASFFVYYIFNNRTVNNLMFPLNILGFFSYFLLKQKDTRPFVLLFLPGIMYSFCIHIGSNLGLMSIGSAMTVSGIAAAIYMADLFKELWEDKQIFSRFVGLGLVAALILQLCVLTYFRGRYTTWNGETSDLSITIDKGPLKGLISKPETVEYCYSLLEETAPIRDNNGENVMYLYTYTWLYLTDSKKCGAFSNWMSYVFPEKDMQRLTTYWQMHPDKVPDAIFIGDKGDKLDFLLKILPGTWTVTESENGCSLFPTF